MIETILVIGIVIACTVWFMRRLWRRRAQRLVRRHATELEVLGERYAKGEISRDEYMQKRSDIIGYPLAPQARSSGRLILARKAHRAHGKYGVSSRP